MYNAFFLSDGDEDFMLVKMKRTCLPSYEKYESVSVFVIKQIIL